MSVDLDEVMRYHNDKQDTANRTITSCEWFTANKAQTVVCVITLAEGTPVIGNAIFADSDDFDERAGRYYALTDGIACINEIIPKQVSILNLVKPSRGNLQ